MRERPLSGLTPFPFQAVEEAGRANGEPYEFQIKTHEPSRRRREGRGIAFVMVNSIRRTHAFAMKTDAYVPKSAAEDGIAEEEALKKGMEEKLHEPADKGSELYAKLRIW